MDTTSRLGATMRVLRPAPHLIGFYDGRIEGARLHSAQPNWLDDGAYSLGICSYAVIDGAEALVYDTHISPAHARRIREVLAAEGVRQVRVALSHHHKDHVAGNEVFADCPIMANAATAVAMEAMAGAARRADPPIDPLVMPSEVFDEDLALTVGAVPVELRSYDIHSHDGLVLWLPATGELLAGDTLEDPITYVDEADRLEEHLRELDRLARLPIARILPNHGAPEVIAAGGYGPGLIGATRAYLEGLLRCRSEPALASLDLRAFVADSLATGAIRYHPAYEVVHRRNVASVLAA